MLTFSLLFLYLLYFMPRCQLFLNVETCLWHFNNTCIFIYCLCIDYNIDYMILICIVYVLIIDTYIYVFMY